MDDARVTLRVLGVDFSYGTREVLRGITVTLEGGEFIGLMGPNGSGKTTLLKVMNNVLKPRKGTVMVDEREVSKLKIKDMAKLFGVVSQEYETSFSFTALDVVLMGRNPYLSRLRGESKRDYEIAIKSMELTNTLHLVDRPFNELSGGEKQRVMIARALAQEPKIMLLDEPTSHLDVSSQIEILELLKKLCKEKGLLIIAVIHDFNLAAYYCDKIILMKDGCIYAMGKPEEVLTPESIEEVFGVKVSIQRHPITGTIYVTPLPISKAITAKREKRIHVICGGGTGVMVLKALVDKGFKVTSGVLNILDSDYEVAIDLCEEVVYEAPFSPISDSSHKRNLELIEKSDAVILTDVPIGWGNFKNLEAVSKAIDMGKKVYLIETRMGLAKTNNRDYTGGEASKELERITKRAVKVSSIDNLLELLHKE
ncbi:MAG: ATP-binding cassette domain-containing protein [Candidatus Nezhaarchaeales archaeon]